VKKTTSRIADTDSYKLSHAKQYPPGTTRVFSNITARDGEYDETLWFGIQGLLSEHFSDPVEMSDVEEMVEIAALHGLPFEKEGWTHIVKNHGGYLPLHIRAVPEGTLVPTGNVLMTVVNTDPKVPWLTNYVETALMRVWYPSTVATISHYLKRLIYEFLVETADDPKSEIDFKLHDFGSRGVSSLESAGIGGCSHLVNFKGTDTVAALLYARRYYLEEMAGFSIPAAEHSTITSWGKEHEVDAFENMLNLYAKPGKPLAVVSDSYDIFNACTHLWGEQLRQKVIDSGATLIIRPDSGNPREVVNEVLVRLESKFGTTLNSKGYKVLNHVRVIQGDGVNPHSIESILYSLKAKGFSTSNIAFGMGGALLQKCNRDTQSFAMKCSAIEINGEWRDVIKDPITQVAKKSRGGRLDLVQHQGELMTCNISWNKEQSTNSIMQTIYKNGLHTSNVESLATIRKRANARFNS
jgi:nicotinamide phosphoribosyltransferase